MKRKYCCAECKIRGIEEPEYCYSGTSCGCMGKPIDPPLCDSCFDKMIKRIGEENKKWK